MKNLESFVLEKLKITKNHKDVLKDNQFISTPGKFYEWYVGEPDFETYLRKGCFDSYGIGLFDNNEMYFDSDYDKVGKFLIEHKDDEIVFTSTFYSNQHNMYNHYETDFEIEGIPFNETHEEEVPEDIKL